jgi:hypothetical protein
VPLVVSAGQRNGVASSRSVHESVRRDPPIAGGRASPGVSGSHSVCAAASEGMYGPGPSDNFAAMHHSPRDEIFVAGVQRNALLIDNQGVASLHYNHVFVVVMSMRSRRRCLATRPKSHLAPVNSVEDVALDSQCRLIYCGDPVCRMLHELGEIIHGRILSHLWRRPGVPAGSKPGRGAAPNAPARMQTPGCCPSPGCARNPSPNTPLHRRSPDHPQPSRRCRNSTECFPSWHPWHT